jgi:hypothetical protein
MEWVKIDLSDENTIPNIHELVLVCYKDFSNVKHFTISCYVSNDFLHFYDNIWWAIIEHPE